MLPATSLLTPLQPYETYAASTSCAAVQYCHTWSDNLSSGMHYSSSVLARNVVYGNLRTYMHRYSAATTYDCGSMNHTSELLSTSWAFAAAHPPSQPYSCLLLQCVQT